MAAVPMIFTVRQALTACGVNDITLWNGQTAAERMAEDIFDNDFTAAMDKEFTELEADFATYSELTVTQGQIRLTPRAKKNSKALIQWIRDEIRLGRNPNNVAFPVNQATQLIRRYKGHKTFINKSLTIAETAKPSTFSKATKWEDWQPTFVNFLRHIPGRDGVPLSYVIRTNDGPDLTAHPDFLDDYVAMAPLAGEAFVIDAAEVHTYIVKFTAGNTEAESKIQTHTLAHNGRLDFKALTDHYEGVGFAAIDVLRADKILESLFYAGEKKPHMWWAEFERQITQSFYAYDRKEGRQVYSNEMKLRKLLNMVRADFLKQTKATIQMAMTNTPPTVTYD